MSKAPSPAGAPRQAHPLSYLPACSETLVREPASSRHDEAATMRHREQSILRQHENQKEELCRISLSP